MKKLMVAGILVNTLIIGPASQAQANPISSALHALGQLFSRAPKPAPHAVPPPPSVGGVVAPAVKGVASQKGAVMQGATQVTTYMAKTTTTSPLQTAVRWAGIGVGATVTVATIASGVEATLDIAERFGYTPAPHDKVEGNVEHIKSDIKQAINVEEPFKIRYCPDRDGKKWMVSQDVLFCPFDGSSPKEGETVNFEYAPLAGLDGL